jgi:tetratricopeptide (TPR) repeat protein
LSIALPGPDKVPDGPHRELLVRLHDLYSQAGKPATRVISKRIDDEKLESVSYETISALLRGDKVPGWARLQSIIVALCRTSVHKVDVSEELVRFNVLWRRYESPQTPPPLPAPSPPAPRAELPEPQAGPIAARVHGDLPDRAPLFTGREQILDRIARQLAEEPEKPLVLFGPIGSGKTQLAAEYARLHRDRYAVTWWVPAETVEQAGESLRELAGRLGFDDERRLQQAGPYLLIFDGVVSGDVRRLLNTRGGNVIATTRNGGWARDSPHAELEVPDLDPSEAAQLLRKHDPQMTPERMARAVAVVGRSPAGLLFARNGGDLLSGELAAKITEVRDRLADDPALMRLLTLLIGFGPSPVWRWMLEAGPNRDVSIGVFRLLRDLAGLGQLLRILAGSGLARRHPESEWIEIPAIVRLVLRELLPDASGEVNRHDVVQILIASDPGHPDDPDKRAEHRAIAPHIRPAALVDVHRPTAYRTIHHQVRFLFLTGDLRAARLLGQEAAAALAGQDALAPTDELVLQIKRDLAGALRADGRYTDAYRLTVETMGQVGAGTEENLALDLARSWGHDLRIAGEFSRAHDLDETTLRRHTAKYGDDDLRTVASRYNLSVSRRFDGRSGEAARADRVDLDRLREANDPRAVRWANSLAEDLYALGRYREAEELIRPLLGLEPGRQLLRARRMAGIVARRLGRLGDAAEQLGLCYQECVGRLGPDRELTLAAAMSFGNALRELGQFETATHYCSLAVDGYTAAMGAANPLVQVARVNRAAVARASGRSTAEFDEAYAALARLLGEEHPFTVAAGVNRTPSYARARAVFGSDHTDALIVAAADDSPGTPSLDEVIATLRRRFGADHPLVARLSAGVRVPIDVELPSG